MTTRVCTALICLGAAALTLASCDGGSSPARPDQQSQPSGTKAPGPAPDFSSVKWERLSSPAFAGPGDQRAVDVELWRDRWLVVGDETRKEDSDIVIWSSADTETWRRQKFARPGDQFADAVVSRGGRVIVVGTSVRGDEDPMILVSTDGEKWRDVSAQETLRQPGDQRVRSVTVFNARFLVLGSDSPDEAPDVVVWSSRDGSKWIRSRDGDLRGPGDQVANEVIANKRVAVAGGWDRTPPGTGGLGADAQDQRAAIWRSTDGIRWKEVGATGLDFVGRDEKATWTYLTDLESWEGGFVGAGIHEVDAFVEEPNFPEIPPIRRDRRAAFWASDNGRAWERTGDIGRPGPVERPDRAHRFDEVAHVELAHSDGRLVAFANRISETEAENAVHVDIVMWSTASEEKWAAAKEERAFEERLDHAVTDAAWAPGEPGLFVVTGISGVLEDDRFAKTTGRLWTSIDGRAWKRARPSGFFAGGGVNVPLVVEEVGGSIVVLGEDASDGQSNAAMWIGRPGT